MIQRRSVVGLMLAMTLVGCGEAPRPDKARVQPVDTLSETGAAPDVLRIGVIPSTGSKTADRLQPLFDFLSRELDTKVEGKTAAGYDDLARLVNAAEVEVGVFSPAAYVKAREKLDAVEIATATRGGSPTYVGYLVVMGEGEQTSTAPPPLLDSLRGKRIAWVHKSSTSGYLYPRQMLRDRGLNPDQFFSEQLIGENHTGALTLLRDGQADVAAVAAGFVDPDADSAVEFADRLVVVAKTARIPRDCVVVHRRLQRRLGVAVRDALTRLHKDHASSAALDRSWGLGGFVHPMSYDEIGKLLGQ